MMRRLTNNLTRGLLLAFLLAGLLITAGRAQEPQKVLRNADFQQPPRPGVITNKDVERPPAPDVINNADITRHAEPNQKVTRPRRVTKPVTKVVTKAETRSAIRSTTRSSSFAPVRYRERIERDQETNYQLNQPRHQTSTPPARVRRVEPVEPVEPARSEREISHEKLLREKTQLENRIATMQSELNELQTRTLQNRPLNPTKAGDPYYVDPAMHKQIDQLKVDLQNAQIELAGINNRLSAK